MVSPNGFVEGGSQILSVLPPEIASTILLLIKTIGGLFIVYIIFLTVRLYFQRKQTKMIREMREDIKDIKKRLKIQKNINA